MLGPMLLSASRNERVRRLVTTLPTSRNLVERYVAGETPGDAVRVTRDLMGAGLLVTLDHLGEDTRDLGQVERTREAYVLLLSGLAGAGLGGGAEVSVKLSAVGQFLGGDGEQTALRNARAICAAARAAGTTVTLDMEDHGTTDSTLRILRELRADFPDTGVAVQAYLRRSEDDCRALAGEGARVRLCKGAYAEPGSVAFTSRGDIDRAYVRCLRILMAGDGYPMVATHDPRLIEIASALAGRHRREPDAYEYQMLHGVRPGEQLRLVEGGHRVRVYLPYGADSLGYLMRRLAERPANLALFLRSVASRS